MICPWAGLTKNRGRYNTKNDAVMMIFGVARPPPQCRGTPVKKSHFDALGKALKKAVRRDF